MKRKAPARQLFCVHTANARIGERAFIFEKACATRCKRSVIAIFQPQVDGTGQQVGAEALIRWNNPAQGFISPLKFIRVAEETGLINPIGDWVMQNPYWPWPIGCKKMCPLAVI